MRKQHGARNREWGATRSDHSLFHPSRAALSSGGAFSLLEMLVVIAIIAILSALTLPALRGLVGVNGVRGGVSTVLGTLDQARAAAIENGTDVYVGFPPATFNDANDPGTTFSSMIIFRGAKFDEENGTFSPLTRWLRLPPNVLMQVANITLSNPAVAASALPKLAGQPVVPQTICYDRFGRVRNAVQGGSNITIGEGFVDGGQLKWKGDNREILSAQRLTGRWIVTRP